MNTCHCVLTFSGHYLNVLHPDPVMISITDIAHALSQINRFGGHTREPYSVAQHSVLVSHLVPPQYRLQALLHDAAEAYLGDIVSPVKYVVGMEPLRDMESTLQAAIFHKFGMGMAQDSTCLDAIRHADLTMLATERRDLMPTDDEQWPVLAGIAPLKSRISPMDAYDAKTTFLLRFEMLHRVPA